MTPFDCPRCGVGLFINQRTANEIDYCPQCRGVWLDRGELDKLIERSTSRESHRDVDVSHPPEYRNPTGHSGGYSGHGSHKPHKKKSMWREIFDFD